MLEKEGIPSGFCPSCGKEVGEGQTYCSKCGETVGDTGYPKEPGDWVKDAETGEWVDESKK
tara:strand:+ start:29 stop:211 length:183 start_codon:yes stop_codon:yes gene_type:complete